MMGLKKEFDLAILFSADTDFKPILELYHTPEIEARVEVVA